MAPEAVKVRAKVVQRSPWMNSTAKGGIAEIRRTKRMRPMRRTTKIQLEEA
jgi:hypothetical protein